MKQICAWPHCPNEVEPRGKKGFKIYCSRGCKNKNDVDRRRKKIKSMSVEYLGGKCVRCGWNEHQCGLVPHHKNPKEKEFSIGTGGHSRSWERTRIELDKCILLCSNCHNVVHTLKIKEYFGG